MKPVVSDENQPNHLSVALPSALLGLFCTCNVQMYLSCQKRLVHPQSALHVKVDKVCYRFVFVAPAISCRTGMHRYRVYPVFLQGVDCYSSNLADEE